MFLDPVVRVAASRRARMLAAVAVAAAVVVTSIPAESATRKKQAAASPAASPAARSVGSAAFALPSSVALVDDVSNGAAIVRQGSVASLGSSTVSVGFAKGEVLGAKFNKRFPEKPVFDEGMDMRPPYGDCGVACGLNFFFPASLTKTGINVLGIVTGGGQLGFNVGGSGVVSYDYESLVNGAVVASTRVSSGEKARTHRVSTDGRTGMTARFNTTLPEKSLGKIPFGYRLSNPGYDWNIAITPVVKASGSFDYVVGTYDFTLGPYALPMSIELGTLKLPRHAGTQEKADKVDGEVTTDQRAAGNVPNLTVSSIVVGSAQVATTPTTTRPGRNRRKKTGGPAAATPPQASVVAATPAVVAPVGSKPKRRKGDQANTGTRAKRKAAA